MPLSAFHDPDHPPAPDAVDAALGAHALLWRALVDFCEGPCGAHGSWVHQGRATGWVLRFVRAGRPFVTLAPEVGSVAALVIIGERDREAAFGLDLGACASTALRDARRYPDGTWVYVRPGSAADVADLRRLLAVKLPPTIRARVEAALARE
jgi:hypothetical protein